MLLQELSCKDTMENGFCRFCKINLIFSTYDCFARTLITISESFTVLVLRIAPVIANVALYWVDSSFLCQDSLNILLQLHHSNLHEVLSRDMGHTGINVILWSNTRKKRIQIRQVFNFAILWFWNFCRVQKFAKIVKNLKNRKIE